ncbi:DNA invertase Pin-like site-specific DNA recombinase [Bradyrhizobium japonicum USDA 38]|nr:DNA invertase Pin-like site-specific DNA recombinase [Bradyrhizobium japonicum USDA 38]MCS3945405.1 DNA invertase Pin-like site-specific DNA recombinase [Bradyrhizobium japonicum]MCW2222069.1 DNA invertase Pin-like site-specific DNA recombinase [Bradyrhizobium japonicum]MCW2346681.1 DNA invertase Pin-like site-specific DNA recombinase [Bradyrhizobium japonicum]
MAVYRCARVSTEERTLAGQEQLAGAEAVKVFSGKISGASAGREGPSACSEGAGSG